MNLRGHQDLLFVFLLHISLSFAVPLLQERILFTVVTVSIVLVKLICLDVAEAVKYTCSRLSLNVFGR